MFTVEIEFDSGRVYTAKHVYEVEHCDNEDGQQLLIFFVKGDGERYPFEIIKKVTLLPEK